jgi:hypothetical protein
MSDGIDIHDVFLGFLDVYRGLSSVVEEQHAAFGAEKRFRQWYDQISPVIRDQDQVRVFFPEVGGLQGAIEGDVNRGVVSHGGDGALQSKALAAPSSSTLSVVQADSEAEEEPRKTYLFEPRPSSLVFNHEALDLGGEWYELTVRGEKGDVTLVYSIDGKLGGLFGRDQGVGIPDIKRHNTHTLFNQGIALLMPSGLGILGVASNVFESGPGVCSLYYKVNFCRIEDERDFVPALPEDSFKLTEGRKKTSYLGLITDSAERVSLYRGYNAALPRIRDILGQTADDLHTAGSGLDKAARSAEAFVREGLDIAGEKLFEF